MNSVVVRKDTTGRYCGFTSVGHAGYKTQGHDIVCAGISVLVLTAVMALEQFTALQPAVKQSAGKDKQAFVECDWINDPAQAETSDLIIKIMLLGLSQIRQQFPQHLTIQELEV